MTKCKCTNNAAIEHTTGCLYEHFLSYTGAKHTTLLCKAYFDGRNAPHEEYEAYMQEHTEPMQEPVGEIVIESMGVRGSDAMQVRIHFYKEVPSVGTKIYTTPPTASQAARQAIEECAKRAEAYAYMSENFNVLAAELRSMK